MGDGGGMRLGVGDGGGERRGEETGEVESGNACVRAFGGRP